MFCSKCGNKLDDNAVFCPHCGSKIIRNTSTGIPSVSIDLQSIKNKTATVASNIGNLAKDFRDGTISDVKKYFYGMIISLVFTLIFGVSVINSFTPNTVRCEVTYASEPEQRGIHKIGRPNDYYWLQDITATYKGKEFSKELRLDSEYEAYHRGDTIELNLVGGKLTDSKKASINSVGGIIRLILLVASIGSCGWFYARYSKKRRG